MIRLATVNDLPWLRHMWEGLVADGLAKHPTAYPTMDAEEADRFTLAVYRHLTQNENFHIYVAEEAGTLQGFLAGQITERAIGKPRYFCEPYWLYVTPEARGKRVGRQLIDAGLDWLRSRGVTHIEVAALAGDPQWQRRRFQPFLSKLYASVDDLTARPRPRAPTVRQTRPPRVPKRKRARMNGHTQPEA